MGIIEMTYPEMDLQSQCATAATDVLAKSIGGELLVLVYFSGIDKVHISVPSVQFDAPYLATLHMTLLTLSFSRFLCVLYGALPVLFPAVYFLV